MYALLLFGFGAVAGWFVGQCDFVPAPMIVWMVWYSIYHRNVYFDVIISGIGAGIILSICLLRGDELWELRLIEQWLSSLPDY